VGLGHSSFDGGAIQQNTSSGTPGSVFGAQYDGTNGVAVLSGPPPPTPSTPTGEGTIGAVTVRWDGTWAAGGTTVAPGDYSGVEVHLADTPDFSALLFDTLKGNITSARGGELFIAVPPGTYYARLVARSASGRASAPSASSGPIVSRPVVREDLGFDIDMLAGNSIFRGADQPTEHADGTPLLYGDLWLQTPDNVAYQWSPPDPGGWLQVQDQNIVKAINDAADAAGLAASAGLSASQAHDLATAAQTAASDAQTVAGQANTAAQAASSAAALAQSTATSKVTVYRQTSAPTGGSYVVNDLWLDTGHNNMLFAWSGSAWVASDDQRIATALTNASTAQTVAGAKTTLFAQTSAPATTGRVVGDTWIDTDDSNKVYVWSGSAWTVTLFGAAALGATARQLGAVTTYRQATQPTGTLIAGDLWIDSTTNQLWSYSGTAWVASQDVGIQTALTNASTAQTTANNKTTTSYQTSAPSTTGRVTGDLWIDTDDGNKIYTWSSGAWTATTLSSQALNVTARQLGAITIYRQTSAPTTGMIVGDYWIDSSPTGGNKAYLYQAGGWVLVQDAAIQSALTNAATAQATADGKAVIYYQTSQPTGQTAADVGDEWVDTDDAYVTYTWSGTAWVKNAISTSSFQPNSLVASTVVATGSITAALLQAILVLATTIVAGDPNADHAKMTPSGFFVYRKDPSGGAPIQAIRLGIASTNDFFAIVNAAGTQVASIDDTGQVNASGLNVQGDPIFQGTKLTDRLNPIPGSGQGRGTDGAQHWYGANGAAGIGGVTSETGLIEMPIYATAGRAYLLIPDVLWEKDQLTTECRVRVRDGGTSSPTITSPQIYYRQFSNSNQTGYGVMASDPGLWFCNTTGQHRLLVTVEANAGNSLGVFANIPGQPDPSLFVLDMGPAKSFANVITNRGGAGGVAAPPPARQQYYQELGPVQGWNYRGDGSVRSDTTDIVQGWDPSGNNGDCHGFWTFNLPSITGTIDRIDLYSYSNHWYFNSGGTALFNIIKAGDGGAGINGIKLSATDFPVNMPSPGGVTVTLPSAWYPSFANAAGANRVVGISAGPSGNTNEIYYGRFNGPDIRLRIWWTQ
jgi:hypothetical protein